MSGVAVVLHELVLALSYLAQQPAGLQAEHLVVVQHRTAAEAAGRGGVVDGAVAQALEAHQEGIDCSNNQQSTTTINQHE